jgi:hypothetical protein
MGASVHLHAALPAAPPQTRLLRAHHPALVSMDGGGCGCSRLHVLPLTLTRHPGYCRWKKVTEASAAEQEGHKGGKAEHNYEDA